MPAAPDARLLPHREAPPCIEPTHVRFSPSQGTATPWLANKINY
jgi:hypothetical protein